MDPEEFLRRLQESFDEGALVQLHKLASVSAEEVLELLRKEGLEVYGLGEIARVATPLLDHVAETVIAQQRRSQAVSGLGFGLGGLLSIAPELVFTMVSLLRLAQRLSLTYGLECHSPSGSILLWRSIARSLDVEVNLEGPESGLIKNLPMVMGRGPFRDPLLLRVVQQVLLAVGLKMSMRFSRLIPVVGAGLNGLTNYAYVGRVGSRLKEDFRTKHQLQHLNLAEDMSSESIPYVLVERRD